MAIKQKNFDKQLDALMQADGERTLAYNEGDDEMSVTLVGVDRFACSFLKFHLNTPRLAGATVDDVKGVSTRIKDRVTYLMEPLELVETDSNARMTQVRSSPPAVDEAVRSYYEVRVACGGYIDLVRYRKEPGSERKQIPGSLTREVAMRLMNDLMASIDPPTKKK